MFILFLQQAETNATNRATAEETTRARASERERETRKTRYGADDRDEREGGIPLDALQRCRFTALPLRTVTCILEALPSYRGKMFCSKLKKKKLEIFFYKYNLFVLGEGGGGESLYKFYKEN